MRQYQKIENEKSHIYKCLRFESVPNSLGKTPLNWRFSKTL